jgi:hypothetical protein
MEFGPGQFAAAAAAIRAGTPVDYEGASGPIDFDMNGDVVAPYDVWKVSGGMIVVAQQAVVP